MDGQRNEGTPSQPQVAENQSPVQSESSEQYSPPSSVHSYPQQRRHEVDSLENSLQNPASTSAQSDHLGQEGNEPTQPQNAAHTTHLHTQPSIRDEARVGVVMYDMLMRAGPQAEMMSAELAEAYPVAAALARNYAMSASHLLPYLVQNSSRRRGRLVLRRVSISSVAWFCSFIASIFALLRLWVIFALALAAAVATSTENTLMYQIVDNVAILVIDRGPKRHLYRWMFNMLNERAPLVIAGTNGAAATGINTMIPNHAAIALLITPVTSGILGFITGALAALCINSALRAAGGIRLDSHED